MCRGAHFDCKGLSLRFRPTMMLLASAGGSRAPVIAGLMQAVQDTVRGVIHRQSRRPGNARPGVTGSPHLPGGRALQICPPGLVEHTAPRWVSWSTGWTLAAPAEHSEAKALPTLMNGPTRRRVERDQELRTPGGREAVCQRYGSAEEDFGNVAVRCLVVAERFTPGPTAADLIVAPGRDRHDGTASAFNSAG